MVNLNHGLGLSVGRLPKGKTQNIVCRLGHRLYYIDVDKYGDTALVEFYPKKGTDRRMQSKYDGDTAFVYVRPNAYLTRTFFENIRAISAAQSTLSWASAMFGDVLKK